MHSLSQFVLKFIQTNKSNKTVFRKEIYSNSENAFDGIARIISLMLLQRR